MLGASNGKPAGIFEARDDFFCCGFKGGINHCARNLTEDVDASIATDMRCSVQPIIMFAHPPAPLSHALADIGKC